MTTSYPNRKEVQRMRQRKVPLFIHVDPMHLVVIGYTPASLC